MAIKGKGRSKRRGVAAAPKPVYVQPKRPLLRRRAFWIPALIILVLGTAAGITTGLLVEHHHNQQKALQAKEAGIVGKFGTDVDNDLAGVGQPFQTQFQAFPDLSSDVTKLQAGQLSAADARKEGRKWARLAAAAQTSIEQIPVAQMIEGHADLIDLSNAQVGIADGLSVYQQAANALKLAGKATGPLQKDLITHTQDLISTAQKVFNDGYQKLINARSKFNLVVPVPPQASTSPSTPVPVISVPTVPSTSPSGSKQHKKK